MEKKDQKSRIMRLLAQVVIIMAGLSVYAAGVALFVLPMDMIAAGTTGLGLVAQHYWGIPLSIFVAGFNILMFVVGLVELGKEFALSTLVATFYYPFALEQATRLVGDMVFTDDPILCAVFSGVMIGFALGIVIRAGASTGGMDIPPLVLKKRFGIPVSVTMYVMDFMVLIAQMTFGDRERILYGLIMVMTYTIILDKVLVIGVRQTQAKIISERYEEISTAIQEKMDHAPLYGRRSFWKAVQGYPGGGIRKRASEAEPDRHGYRRPGVYDRKPGGRGPRPRIYADKKI